MDRTDAPEAARSPERPSRLPAAVRITETALRDGHQSLLATRMRTEHMLPALADIDAAGYFAVEMWGGATFDSCIRYLDEDPWQRCRAIRAGLPHTKTMMLLRGQNVLGYRHYADDVVEAFVERAVAAGIDILRIFDALNDVRNLRTAIRATLAVGAHAQGAFSYTTSPVHTIAGFVDLACELEDLGCHSICIKDMAGLLHPAAAYELVRALKARLGVPIELHGHCTSGMAEMAYLKAIEAGVDIVDCALSPLGGGTSQPPTEAIVAALAGGPRDTGIPLPRLTGLARHFREVRKAYAAFESPHTGVDTNVLEFQIPGGMISNLAAQLKAAGAEERFAEVLDEVPRVRRDLGYPPLVTPTSQIVGTQAAFNVLFGRYERLTTETTRYLLGHYGQAPAPVDEALQQRAGGSEPVIACRPADLLAPELPRAREQGGELIRSLDDVLTVALFEQVGLKFLERREGRAVAKDAGGVAASTTASAPPPAASPADGAAPPAAAASADGCPTTTFAVELGGRRFVVQADRPFRLGPVSLDFAVAGRALRAEVSGAPEASTAAACAG